MTILTPGVWYFAIVNQYGRTFAWLTNDQAQAMLASGQAQVTVAPIDTYQDALTNAGGV